MSKDIEKKSWQEFRKSGLLFLVNTILHAFGWCIIVTESEGGRSGAYPARVKYRGFSEKDSEESYKKIAKYLRDESPELYAEVHTKPDKSLKNE